MKLKHEDTKLLAGALLLLVTVHIAGGALWPQSRVEVLVVISVLLLMTVTLHVRRMSDLGRADLARRTQAVTELNHLIPFRRPLPPMSGWAASPELAATVFAEMRDARPEVVVELGSGVTTIIAGYTAEMNARGHVLSIDHDASYLESTARTISRHDLDRVALAHAPLGSVTMEGAEYRWYDLSGVDLPPVIDMLIVDGPPRETAPRARYPTFPAFRNRLGSAAVIIFDDADRAEEADLIARWAADGEWFVDRVPSSKGIVVLRRKGAV